jgi:hypothetical protein
MMGLGIGTWFVILKRRSARSSEGVVQAGCDASSRQWARYMLTLHRDASRWSVKFLVMAFVVSFASVSSAGPTSHVAKEATKGVAQEVKKETQNMDLQEGARKVGSGLVAGVGEHGRAIDRGARDLGRSIAQGFLLELRTELGSDGGGPLGKSMAGAGQRGTAAAVHGIIEELSVSACGGEDRGACIERLVQRYASASSRAAAKGAADVASPWPSIFAVAGGFAAGLLCAAIIALLLGQRRTRQQVAALRPQTA